MCIPNLVKIIHHCNRVDFTEISITFNWIFYRRRHQHNTVTVSAAAASKANMFRIEQGGASWRVPASWTLGHPRSARLFVWFRPSYPVGCPSYRVGSGRVPSYRVLSGVSLCECPAQAPKNNYAYAHAVDMTSKLTPRESSAILYLSSRVPRTSTEEQLHTRSWYEFKIDT